MNIYKRLNSAVILVIFSSLMVSGETVARQRIEQHLLSIEWEENSLLGANGTVPSISITGGTETFPVTQHPEGGNVLPTIYPRYKNLGVLDYSGFDELFLTFIDKVTQSIRQKNLSVEYVPQTHLFLPVIVNYRLQKLPEINEVRFSRPVMVDDSTFSILLTMSAVDTDTVLPDMEIEVVRKEDLFELVAITFRK